MNEKTDHRTQKGDSEKGGREGEGERTEFTRQRGGERERERF